MKHYNEADKKILSIVFRLHLIYSGSKPENDATFYYSIIQIFKIG